MNACIGLYVRFAYKSVYAAFMQEMHRLNFQKCEYIYVSILYKEQLLKDTSKAYFC